MSSGSKQEETNSRQVQESNEIVERPDNHVVVNDIPAPPVVDNIPPVVEGQDPILAANQNQDPPKPKKKSKKKEEAKHVEEKEDEPEEEEAEPGEKEEMNEQPQPDIYPRVRPVDFDCKKDVQCDAECDVCCSLPYDQLTGMTLINLMIAQNHLCSSGIMQVHHYYTNQGLWNADNRFINVPLKAEDVIVYVGGNNDGSDGYSLLQQCPTWYLCIIPSLALDIYNLLFLSQIHIFEPVSIFYATLKTIWDGYIESFGWKAKTYMIGLGKDDR